MTCAKNAASRPAATTTWSPVYDALPTEETGTERYSVDVGRKLSSCT